MKFPTIHPTLIVDNLVLKAVNESDMVELEEICSYRPEKDRTAQELLDLVEGTFEDKSSINWGIYLEGKLIGTVGFYRGFNGGKGEVGYVTIEAFRGNGYAYTAVQKVIKYGLEEMNLINIDAQTLENNHASKALLLKLGFHLTKEKEEPYLIFRLK